MQAGNRGGKAHGRRFDAQSLVASRSFGMPMAFLQSPSFF